MMNTYRSCSLEFTRASRFSCGARHAAVKSAGTRPATKLPKSRIVIPSLALDVGVSASGSPLYTARTPSVPSVMRHVSKINELAVRGHSTTRVPKAPSAAKIDMSAIVTRVQAQFHVSWRNHLLANLAQ